MLRASGHADRADELKVRARRTVRERVRERVCVSVILQLCVQRCAVIVRA
jgi:hypothetical protein